MDWNAEVYRVLALYMAQSENKLIQSNDIYFPVNNLLPSALSASTRMIPFILKFLLTLASAVMNVI
jgi:hypothetical protein